MTYLLDLPLAALFELFRDVVFVFFVLVALLLMIVILIQEGKGGGLGSAFGGAAADMFGVKAGSVSRFTSYLGAAFLLLALLHAGLSSQVEQAESSITPAPTRTEEIPGATGGAGTMPGSEVPGEGTPTPEDAGG